MSQNTQIGQRLVFENAKTLITGLGYDVSHAVLTPSFLKSEVLLATTAASYHIPVLINDNVNGTPTVREVRLNLQDLFIVCALQVLLVSGASTNGAAKFYSYPNLTAFPTGAAQLYNLYNGYLTIQVNNQNILPKWSLQDAYIVNQTQQNTNFNVASPTSPSEFAIDQLNGSADGYQIIEPNIVLNGASNIQATVVLPAAPSAIDANTYVAFKWYGILAQNCTSVK
jgi:hypothetical protein